MIYGNYSTNKTIMYKPFLRSLRNIYRNSARAILVTFIIGLSVAAFLTMLAARASVEDKAKELKSEVATTIQIRPFGSTGMGGPDGKLLDERLVDEVKNTPYITKVEKYILERFVDNTKEPAISIAVGVEPGATLRPATHGEVAITNLVWGRNLQPEDAGKNIALVGKVYADTRQTIFGYPISEMLHEGVRTKIGDREFVIVGIFSTGFAFGDNQVFMPFDTAQKLFDKPNQVSQIYALVDSAENVAQAEETLKTKLGKNADVVSRAGSAKSAALYLDSIQSSTASGAAFSILVGALVVLFTMFLMSRERTKEIGILKAIGASNIDVSKQFFLESITLSILGGLVGLIIYLVAAPALAVTILGTQAPAPATGLGESPVSILTLSYGLPPLNLFLAFGVVVLFGLLGSLYPMYRALKLKPDEAIRYE